MTFLRIHTHDNYTKCLKKISRIEISEMWSLKTETVPVVIGAPGLVKKAWGNIWKKKIPEKIDIEELQKISLLGTALRKNNDSPQPLPRKLLACWSPEK